MYGLYTGKAIDLIPHLIMSHGFIEWHMKLSKDYPSLSWKGQADEEVVFEDYMYTLFLRFAEALMEGVDYFPPEQKDQLIALGWKAYLED